MFERLKEYCRGFPGNTLGKQRREAERGVALLMVLTTLALLGSVVADFQFNAHVDVQLAINARDELQAEYNALSALRLRALIVKHATNLQNAIAPLFAALGLGPQAAPPINQLLEMIPVECGLMSAITKIQKDTFAETGHELKQKEEKGSSDDFFPGECLATSESEHSKIAVNLLYQKANNADQAVTQLLLGLLSDKNLERHFQEDDKNGTHAESPRELVGALVDWIDPNKDEVVNQVSDEDRRYTYLKDSYHAKNGPFDSVDELQLVHGVDDELFAILNDQITVYSDSTAIELPTASALQIGAGILSTKLPTVDMDQILPPLVATFASINDLKTKGGGFVTLNTTLLQQLLTQSGIMGMLDQGRLSQAFTDRSSNTWYTFRAEGHVGNASVRLKSVFQAREGRFYYYRME